MSRRDPTEEPRDPMAGLPAPQAGEEVEVETRRLEVVEQGSGARKPGARRTRRSEVTWDQGATKEELMEVAQGLDIPGRSTMTKDELLRAIDRAEGGQLR